MDWFFDGLGTLLIGLVLGAGGGSAITWRIAVSKLSQRQSAGDNSNQVQAGNNVKTTDIP
jgi:hypothetical protein